MTENESDALIRDLALLARGSSLPEPSPALTPSVMRRISAPPAMSWFAARGRQVAVVIAAVLLALLATPPVRAAVSDWFGFGGVAVEESSPGSGPASAPPEVTEHESIDDAAAAVDFTVLIPAELGTPDGIEASRDERMVSMSWSGGADGVVRLDQFDATLDYSVLKRAPNFVFTTVDGRDALWFEEPHELALLNPDGTTRTESTRLAGHTLVWLDGITTLRLEGDVTLPRAIEIAESSQPVG